MTPIELISVVVALCSALYAFLAHRKIKGAYDDSAATLQWVINKLEKSRYEARKEYESTGWAPNSDKPDSKS